MADTVAIDRSELETLRALASGFHACKNIRAWAAEENLELKRAMLARLDDLLKEQHP